MHFIIMEIGIFLFFHSIGLFIRPFKSTWPPKMSNLHYPDVKVLPTHEYHTTYVPLKNLANKVIDNYCNPPQDENIYCNIATTFNLDCPIICDEIRTKCPYDSENPNSGLVYYLKYTKAEEFVDSESGYGVSALDVPDNLIERYCRLLLKKKVKDDCCHASLKIAETFKMDCRKIWPTEKCYEVSYSDTNEMCFHDWDYNIEKCPLKMFRLKIAAIEYFLMNSTFILMIYYAVLKISGYLYSTVIKRLQVMMKPLTEGNSTNSEKSKRKYSLAELTINKHARKEKQANRESDLKSSSGADARTLIRRNSIQSMVAKPTWQQSYSTLIHRQHTWSPQTGTSPTLSRRSSSVDIGDRSSSPSERRHGRLLRRH